MPGLRLVWKRLTLASDVPQLFASVQEEIDIRYRMRFLWPVEIDADRAHYEELLWNTRLAACFGRCPSAFQRRPRRAMRWQRQHLRLDGRVGYLIFDRRFTDCVIEICDFRPKPVGASKAT